MTMKSVVLSFAVVIPMATWSGAAMAQDEPVTLRVWDDFAGPEAGTVEALYQQFMEQHPNVTIEREVYNYEQLRATTWLALRAGGGPDVLYVDVAPARELAAAELLTPLDTYADQYGWRDRIFPAGLEWGTFNDSLYGIGVEYEFVGVFYNETLMQEAGLAVPSSLGELLEFCRRATELGYVPMAHSQNPGWQSFFSFVMPLTNILGPDAVRQLVTERQGSWDTPEVIRAIRVFHEEMRDANCFIDEVNALDYEGATDMFVTGEALMFPTGTWITGSIEELSDPGHVIKMMPFVSIDGTAGDRVYTTGMGSIFSIPTNSENPDLAAELIDLLVSTEAATAWVEAGIVPPMPLTTEPEGLSDLKRFVLETLQEAGTGSGNTQLGLNIDLFVSEEFNALMIDGFQGVVAGTKTAEQQAADLQALWETSAE